MTRYKQFSLGIVINRKKEVYITKRLPSSYMAGKSEFPGGKVRTKESPKMAVVRELYEEIDIYPIKVNLIGKVITNDSSIFWFWIIKKWWGRPWGKEAQQASWIAQSDVIYLDFPAINKPIVKKISSL